MSDEDEIPTFTLQSNSPEKEPLNAGTDEYDKTIKVRQFNVNPNLEKIRRKRLLIIAVGVSVTVLVIIIFVTVMGSTRQRSETKASHVKEYDTFNAGDKLKITNMEDDQIEKATFTLQEDNVPEAVPLKPGRRRKAKRESKPKSKCGQLFRRPITIIVMGVTFITIALIFFFSLYADLTSMQNSKTKLVKDHGLLLWYRDSTLVNFTMADNTTYSTYVNSLSSYLSVYNSHITDAEKFNCHRDRGKNRTACPFDVTSLGPYCTQQNGYGYHDGSPCLLMTLKLPDGMNPSVKNNSDTTLNPTHIGIVCSSKLHGGNSTSSDVSKDVTFMYHPSRGFPLASFPSSPSVNYTAPLVFVKLSRMPKGRPVHIVCRALTESDDTMYTETYKVQCN